MNKTINKIASFILALVTILGNYSSALAATGSGYDASPTGSDVHSAAFQPSAFYKRLAPGDSVGWGTETSGSMEKVTATVNAWVCEAGGYAASSHYARLKYKVPEKAGMILTTFYMKLVVVIPKNFYGQQNAGFRLMNTDNHTTMLDGVPVGANDKNESRTSVYINSNHTLQVIVDHELMSKKILYASQARLPIGEHTIELFGSLNEVAPWYLRVDGVVVASGTEMLSTDDTTPNERVATRFVVGIDGAANQDANLMRLRIKSFEIANYDMAGVTTTPAQAQTLSGPDSE
jgi:hypothetical protein